MNQHKASNGTSVHLDSNGRMTFRRDSPLCVNTLEAFWVQAARAFFQAERDDALGRWRDKEALAKELLTAAAPHLRVEWERELAREIRAKFLGTDPKRNPVDSQRIPGTILHGAYDEGVSDILTFLEGVRK